MSRIRILFLTDNYPPEVNAPATRTYEHCREWVRQGARVTVITCHPNFPRGKIFKGHKNRLFEKKIEDGITVIRVWSYMTANEGLFRRTMDYFSYAITAFLAGLFQKADVIVATSPQFFTTWTGWLLSKVKRKPWIFELRDFWPESIAAVGAVKKNGLFRLLEKVEMGLYRNARIIIPNTPAFKTRLVRRGVDSGKIHVIPNGANLEQLRAGKKNGELLTQLGLERKFVYGYMGTHGMAHSLDFIVESLSGITDRRIHFLFVGDGAMKQPVREQAKRLGLENITFIDTVPKSQIATYLGLMDVALVPLRRKELFKTVIPSKIFEACAMDKPILLGVDGQARELVEKYGVGLYFEPENSADFQQKAALLAGSPDLYQKLSGNCHKLVADFDREKLAREMLQVITEKS